MGIGPPHVVTGNRSGPPRTNNDDDGCGAAQNGGVTRRRRSGALDARIGREELLASGERGEVGLRTVGVHAVELLVERLRSAGHDRRHVGHGRPPAPATGAGPGREGQTPPPLPVHVRRSACYWLRPGARSDGLPEVSLQFEAPEVPMWLPPPSLSWASP